MRLGYELPFVIRFFGTGNKKRSCIAFHPFNEGARRLTKYTTDELYNDTQKWVTNFDGKFFGNDSRR